MRSIITLFGIQILLLFSCANTESNDLPPVEIDTDNFSFVLYDGLSQDKLASIQSKLSDNYVRVLGDFEITSMGKVTVRIWSNEKNFLDDMERAIGRRYTGASGWVYSATDIRVLYRGNATGQIALHEFCHAASLVVNNRIGNNPRWLWEAVAIYEAGEFVDPKTLSYLVSGNYPTIAELNSDFNSGANKIYSVGYLLSEFIITTWDKSRYVGMIKSNGNIQETLGITTQEFESDWKKFVIAKYF